MGHNTSDWITAQAGEQNQHLVEYPARMDWQCPQTGQTGVLAVSWIDSSVHLAHGQLCNTTGEAEYERGRKL